MLSINDDYNMKIIQAYAPITKHEDEEIEDFYKNTELKKINCFQPYLP